MSVIGEAALSAFFQALFDKLSSSKFQLATDKQVCKEIEKWNRTLKLINAVLADAEGKQMQNQAVKDWLANLKDLAYDVDDILDEFATQALERKSIKPHHHANTSKIPKFLTFGTTLRSGTVMFNNKLMLKIKEITKTLDDLAAERGKLQLRENDVKGTLPRRPPTSSLVNEGEVYGRKEDKAKIIDLLLRDDSTGGGVSVIPIVGMGGIGKTTLAQLVYNDRRIKDHFDLKAWVCVSDEFDIVKVTKIILQSVTHASCDLTDLNLIQVDLNDKLSGKKFLIVLDDIWNENYEDWIALRRPFDAGAPGSKIIVTTRSSNVSSIMRTVADHLLQRLSEDDSLCMFAHHALGATNFSGYPELKEIGLEIMKKCDGLPLATITVGGLLRTKLNRQAWKDILESEIWNSSEDKSRIVPALWLSYYYLPSKLKQCFAYCSLVPKDYEFTREEIVPLWMAEGFLHQPNSSMPSVDLGRNYFEELVSRSFFQVSSMNKSKFVMHDLINDLAQQVAGEFCFRMEGHERTKFPTCTRHCSYIIAEYDGFKKFEAISEAKRLRTFLPFMMMLDRICYLSNNVVTDLLPKLRCLRVLSLKGYIIREIPDFIGVLKHLRYLDFSYTQIKCLPDSMCTLYNLETLLLKFCERIEKLPSKISILDNLCHLDIRGAYSMKEMPSGIGKLTNLQALSNFIVGEGNGLNIRELQNLSNLKGQLSISELQNVDEAQFACEANLPSKSGLDDLELEWTSDFTECSRKKDIEAEVLKLLRPHEELKALAIKYYAGTTFPYWIGDPSFKNLQRLHFEDCHNCELLPAVGKLPLLKHLYIRGMSSVTSVGKEFYGENWPNAFPSLETLHFQNMPEWKEWKPCEVVEQGRNLCCLRELFIEKCPKLVGTLPDCLPCLEKLVISDCQELVVPISNLPLLCELKIDGAKEVVLGSYDDLWSVKKIRLLNVTTFACVTTEMVVLESMKVEYLKISCCEELASLWQTKWGWLAPLRSLRHLIFENCGEVVCIGAKKEEEKAELLQLDVPCNTEDLRIRNFGSLEKLSKTLLNLTFLRKLEIEGCPKLVSLSTDNLPATLKILIIRNCVNLQWLFDDVENINFSNTSLLESLVILCCGALKKLSSSGRLPVGLKNLIICACQALEFVAQEFGDNTCLESIGIHTCVNITHLPRGLDKLSCLSTFDLSNCHNLVCFPEGGLPTTNLENVSIHGCEKLEALPNLYSLQLRRLFISGCPRMKSTGEGGLPANLKSLSISEPNISKAVMEWGLNRFTSLKNLTIDGSNCIDLVSFPPKEMRMNMKLPSSLINLSIQNFKNLRKLSSKGFQNLTSLRFLSVSNCSKLKSLPKKEMLSSLSELDIRSCPLLKTRYERDKGKLWHNIAHIPCVRIYD